MRSASNKVEPNSRASAVSATRIFILVALVWVFGLVLGVLGGRVWVTWPPAEILRWVGEWAKSPGIAGVAAVIAAVITLGGVRHSSSRQMDIARSDRGAHEKELRTEEWVKSGRWALDLTLSDKSAVRKIGYTTIGVLAGSEFATGAVLDILNVALDDVLAVGPLPDQAGGDGGRNSSDTGSGQGGVR